MGNSLKAPFPYFGGKSKIATKVWKWLGDTKFYIEPFFGSGAVLFARPGRWWERSEIINDKDCLVVNFWRAVARNPGMVARYAAHITSQLDMVARRSYVINSIDMLEDVMAKDPEYFDAVLAGYWLYVQRLWIGDKGFSKKTLDSKKTMKLCNGGKARNVEEMEASMRELSERLEKVLVCHGSWDIALNGKWQTSSGADCGVFLDPPYDFSRHDMVNAYRENENSVSAEVEQWCIANGRRDGMRIVLCGYEDEHDGLLKLGWRKYAWETNGGYSNARRNQNEVTLGLENSIRERCWISPNCLDGNGKKDEMSLFFDQWRM